jgi:aryl-alcohol dehydrogenase-like predicted oxidoreductase
LAGQRGVASVITGATSPTQVKTNAAAAAWTLTPQELTEVTSLV